MSVWRKAMNTITQCPECGTCFKVTQDQLAARQGLVRCGCCKAVFNATEHLRDDQPSPQLELEISQEGMQQTPVAATGEPVPETSGESGRDRQGASPVVEGEPALQPGREMSALSPLAEVAPVTLAQQIIIAEGSVQPRPVIHPQTPEVKKRNRPWIIGSLLLLIVMPMQAVYFLRVEIAAHLPGLKPALVSYCKLFNCNVPLPRKIDLVSIESSDLEADPAHVNVITLHASLRNNASYALAYPDIELSLTDMQDTLLARRTFRPGEYLKPDEKEIQGMVPRRETSVQLRLDTSDLKPTGYRLFLYYP
jgi:predicted Zn finger-like uncharacterized protein